MTPPLTPPNRKVRTLIALFTALSKVGLAPTNEKVVKRPMAKRLAMGPTKGQVGPVPDVPTREVSFPARDGATLRVRVYEPAGATAPVLYIHGGGFAVGGFKACDHICRRIAVEAGVVVVSVEYRLAPDFQYPVPIDDVEDALDWVLSQPWDTTSLVVGGDSAGGNLAAALALRARARGIPLTGQLLIYPALDLTATHEGAVGYDSVGFKVADYELCAATYLGDADPRLPDASPYHEPDLTGLPPALVLTVEHDVLRGEGLGYARRLEEAGVPVTTIDVPGHVHGSLSIPRYYDGIDELHAAIAAFVRSPQPATSEPG